VAEELRLESALYLHLFASRKPWTDQRRLACATTVLSFFVGGNLLGTDRASWRVLRAWIDGFDKKRYRIDSKMFRDLYFSCPKHLKLLLTKTATFIRLDPKAFKTIFMDAYYRQASELPDLRDLASTLNAYFVNFNPKAAHEYKDIILECLRSPKLELHLRGLDMAGFLDDLETEDLQRMKEKIGASSSLRICAMNGLCELLKRRQKVSPRVIAFCLDPKIQAKAERIHGRSTDDGVRLAAYYLLKAIREARSDARTLRKLKAAGYPPP
jgi:hypothetical protein